MLPPLQDCNVTGWRGWGSRILESPPTRESDFVKLPVEEYSGHPDAVVGLYAFSWFEHSRAGEVLLYNRSSSYNGHGHVLAP